MTPPTPTAPIRPGRSLDQRRRRERRILAVGLSVSVAIHLLAIALVGGWLDDEHDPAPRPPTSVRAEPPAGLRVVGLREVPAPAAARPEAPDAREREQRDADVPERERPSEPAPQVAAADTVPADDRTAADRLGVRVVDPRLWRPVILIPREPTLEDVEARIAAAVELLSDSALAEAEAAIRARDWTVEDAEGGRWGISPGKLHLGSVTLPIPVFSVSPEAVREQQMLYELERQLDRTRLLDSFESRVRAIRERREREREEARAAEVGGGG